MISKKTKVKTRVKATTKPDGVTEEILDALEACRQEKGMTLADLSREAGINYTYVQQLLRVRDDEGHRHSPTLDKLAPIARALGLRLKLVRDRR